jgi:hypothetical protein
MGGKTNLAYFTLKVGKISIKTLRIEEELAIEANIASGRRRDLSANPQSLPGRI